jgi:putative addiction module killer protein
MIETVETHEFTRWFENLGRRDPEAQAVIEYRLNRLSDGFAGDAGPVGEGVSELRIHHGPGFRVYYRQEGNIIIVLLAGGIKDTQQADIRLAKKLSKAL